MVQLQHGGYDYCHNRDEVVAKIEYQKDQDREYSSASVFCAKGVSFTVPWHEAKENMHCL